MPLTALDALPPRGVIDVELSVPVTADVALPPKGVIVVEFNVPVTADVPFVPDGVSVCVCVASALPVNVGCVNVPAAIVGTPAGHETVG